MSEVIWKVSVRCGQNMSEAQAKCQHFYAAKFAVASLITSIETVTGHPDVLKQVGGMEGLVRNALQLPAKWKDCDESLTVEVKDLKALIALLDGYVTNRALAAPSFEGVK